MIRYGELQHRDFLAPAWCKKLEEAGVDLSNSTYNIWKSDGTYFIDATHLDPVLRDEGMEFICHTATISDLYDIYVSLSSDQNNNFFPRYNGTIADEPELLIERYAFYIKQYMEETSNIGNKCILKDGSSVIYMGSFTHKNENHPWGPTKMIVYWEDGKDGKPGIAGYLPFDLVTEITNEHITDKSIQDMFVEQHLMNWKEDGYYNFVNYNGIKI